MRESYAWLFGAKSIQRYILDSGRLADLIGASDLVAGLCSSDGNDLLKDVLQAAEAGDVTVSRRAGAALCLHADKSEKLNRVRALWRLAVGMRVPGLPFTDTAPVKGADEGAALRQAYCSQPGLRENDAAFLPPFGGPMTAFNPRTGRVAHECERVHGETRYRDAVTSVQGRRAALLARQDGPDRLVRSFLPETEEGKETHGPTYLFPRHFKPEEASTRNPAFPFGGSADRRIAIIHADISGLGQIFRSITTNAASADEVFAAANAIEAAIIRATRAASEACLLPFAAKAGDEGFEDLFGGDAAPEDAAVVPARPVVLGGDDITILIRADLALSFTQTLLLGIEAETKAEFEDLRSRGDVPEGLPKHGLTACAGLAVVSAGHPFLAAQRMAEGLCSQAKQVAKKDRGAPYPAFLSFAVITSTIEEDFRTSYRPREQAMADGKGKPCWLNSDAYKVSKGNEVAGVALDDLLSLARALTGASGHGKLLSALGERFGNRQAAALYWERYKEVLSEDESACRAVKEALARCVGPGGEDEAGWPSLDKALPVLNDALEVMDFGGAS